MKIPYRGRLAPSPTGYLHLGHAATFWIAQERARAADGALVLRIEDIDEARCRAEFREAVIEDLRWFSLQWSEGPYRQSERRAHYLSAWRTLQAGGFIYPCVCSRQDVTNAAAAPHDEGNEPIYPGTCCGRVSDADDPAGANWRFHVPDGERVTFRDERLGEQSAVAGRDFGDFVIWRRDDVPAYQLAVVVDDAAMNITEVVRGEDLLTSTFRQVLLYRALGLTSPRFFHAPLLRDESGRRLAKRSASLALRTLRANGVSPEELRRRITAAANA